MADLTSVQAAETTKIVGADSSGVEQTPVQSTSGGALHASLRDATTGGELLGQKTAAQSIPVVLANDQTSFPTQGLGTPGTPLGGVLTVQGATGGKPLPGQLFDAAGNAVDTLNSGPGLNALNVALTGTNYVLSAANSTTTQLAVDATFTGTIETIFNQQAISLLLTSDQNGTLTLNQYIDLAGTRRASVLTFTILGGVPFSRCIQGNGNFFNLTFKNTGSATTTTLNINTAYGTLPSMTALGNGQVSLDEINGIPSNPRPDGHLRTALDPSTILFDTFETFDTTNIWTTGGTVIPTQSAGNLNVNPGTAASASSNVKTQFVAQAGTSSYLFFASLVQLNAAVITGNTRFWGLGVFTTPTPTVPVTNGCIFEVDSASGSLLASVYSNSVRTQSATLVRPTDGTTHRYAIYFQASKVYFELDNVLVATFTYPNPQIQAFNAVTGSVNGASPLGVAPTLVVSLMGLADTGKTTQKITDGTYPWRAARVSSTGSLQTAKEEPVTYSAASVGFVPPASAATDVFTITGSATKTIRVHKMRLSGTTTSGSTVKLTVSLIKRSTANTGGTRIAVTTTPHDALSAAATATVGHYTANPTTGTLVGAMRAISTGVTSGGLVNGEDVFDFLSSGQPIILRGVNEQFCVNLNGASITGPVFSISVEWSEL